MNSPKPGHTKRPRRQRTLGNPLIPLYDAYTGSGSPVHIGWYNRRSGDILTTQMNVSQPTIEGKTNKKHITRTWAVKNLGFTLQEEQPNRNNRPDRRRSGRQIIRWWRQQNPTRVIHRGRVTVLAPPLTLPDTGDSIEVESDDV